VEALLAFCGWFSVEATNNAYNVLQMCLKQVLFQEGAAMAISKYDSFLSGAKRRVTMQL
jgi:hypothetical protein